MFVSIRKYTDSRSQPPGARRPDPDCSDNLCYNPNDIKLGLVE